MSTTIRNGQYQPPTWLRVGVALLALYFFAVAVTLMGSSFKLVGRGLAEGVLEWAQNPVMGLFVGIFMTAIVQSSSTVTTMIVTAVAGGVVPVPVAVPMVMGANIGTTVTNSLVAMGSIVRRDEFRRSIAAATVHDFFNLLAVAILLPLEIAVEATGALRASASGQPIGILGWLGDEISRLVPADAPALGVDAGSAGIGFLFKAPASWVLDTLAGLFSSGAHETSKSLSKAALATDTAEAWSAALKWTGGMGVLVGLALLSVCLVFIARNMRAVVLGRMEGAFAGRLLRNPAMGMVLGLVLTVLVQSSSITTSVLVPVAAAGLLRLRAVFFVTLGANVGTTCTGLLAALFLVASGEPGARLGLSIASVHLLFNLVGIAIVLSVPWLRHLPLRLARRFALLCVESKMLAVGYVLGAFFVGPGILLLLYHGLNEIF